MKIQVASNLDPTIIQEEIKHALIVDKGDYILYEAKQRVPVNNGFDIEYLNVNDILIIETLDGASHIHTPLGKYTSSFRLQDLETPPLIRINKSTIINKEAIDDIKVKLNMKYSLRIKDRWFDVNRSYYHSFKETIGL